jgi:hypothetical protein
MKLQTLSAAIFAVALGGCAVPQVNYQSVTTNISEPPLNSINEKQLGDELLRQGKYREHDAIVVQSNYKVGFAYTIHPGYFLKIGEDAETEHYRIGGAGEESGFVEKVAFADPFQSLMVKKATNTLCVITAYNMTSCGDGNAGAFEKVKKPIVTQDSVQRTLIYNGKVGSKINVGYREFSGSAARPAFSNSVEYDLSESMTVGYKGALLEILEATNRLIRYKVISNFNAAEK